MKNKHFKKRQLYKKKLYLKRITEYDHKYKIIFEDEQYENNSDRQIYNKIEEVHKTYDNFKNNYYLSLYNNKIIYAKKIESILLPSLIKKNNLYLEINNIQLIIKIYNEYKKNKLLILLYHILPLPLEIILIIIKFTIPNKIYLNDLNTINNYLGFKEVFKSELNINTFKYSKFMDMIYSYNYNKLIVYAIYL